MSFFDEVDAHQAPKENRCRIKSPWVLLTKRRISKSPVKEKAQISHQNQQISAQGCQGQRGEVTKSTQ